MGSNPLVGSTILQRESAFTLTAVPRMRGTGPSNPGNVQASTTRPTTFAVVCARTPMNRAFARSLRRPTWRWRRFGSSADWVDCAESLVNVNRDSAGFHSTESYYPHKTTKRAWGRG